jgi:hypothetical protein
MNALVKKEIRLLLPAWALAMLLALCQAMTRPYDFYIASLLFLGMTMMALSPLGRETSLNTFSTMLAQPAERLRVWQTKLVVLAVAFLIVFLVWLAADAVAFFNSTLSDSDLQNTGQLFITVCLITTATFTGGLWSTLLLRQLAGAFWLTLLAPATLCGFTAAFLSESQSDNGVVAALCIILGIYSIGGFFFARWLFFRAQDVGWTGGIIALPQLRIRSTRSVDTEPPRTRKPVFALLKKEIQLQQVALTGAAGLLVMHIGIVVLRANHHFQRDSAGEILTKIFWMLWLVLPVIIGAMSIAEERRLGVMEGQLCLPASRRIQFAVKSFVTCFLAIFLGGVMPCLLEMSGTGSLIQSESMLGGVLLGIIGLSVWLSLVSFFASSLARNFLQAVGFAIGTFIVSAMIIPAVAHWRMLFFDSLPVNTILPLLIATPTLAVTLVLLAYLNYKNFRDGWFLLRRSVFVLAGATVFVTVSSAVLHSRAWEVFEPAEPAHGAAKFSAANPPSLKVVQSLNMLVRLPDGRVWFDSLGSSAIYNYDGGAINWRWLWRKMVSPLRESLGPRQFLTGSNWMTASTEKVYFGWFKSPTSKPTISEGYFDTVGIQPDGTLWVSDKPEPGHWTAGALRQFGTETNWLQLAQSRTSVVLLKKDGTLWRWGYVTNEWTDWANQWPGLRTLTPKQIDTGNDWRELSSQGPILAKKSDGSAWNVSVNWKTGKDEFYRATNFDEVNLQTMSRASDDAVAFVRADGTLWVLDRSWDEKTRRTIDNGLRQVGTENCWRAVAMNWRTMVALKNDGSLWQWKIERGLSGNYADITPVRLGIHDDWLAIANASSDSVVALADDGSLWLWPDKTAFNDELLIKLPKQPKYLGNILGSGR